MVLEHAEDYLPVSCAGAGESAEHYGFFGAQRFYRGRAARYTGEIIERNVQRFGYGGGNIRLGLSAAVDVAGEGSLRYSGFLRKPRLRYAALFHYFLDFSSEIRYFRHFLNFSFC